jgi:hypothetical protein
VRVYDPVTRATGSVSVAKICPATLRSSIVSRLPRKEADQPALIARNRAAFPSRECSFVKMLHSRITFLRKTAPAHSVSLFARQHAVFASRPRLSSAVLTISCSVYQDHYPPRRIPHPPRKIQHHPRRRSHQYIAL